MKVRYITEEPRSMWISRLKSKDRDWSNLTLVFGLGTDPATLRRRAASGPEDVVVVDAMRNLLQPRDENDNSEIARVVNPWIADMREAGKTLVVVHHQRKGAGEHGEGIAGGHALLGAFDQAIELKFDGDHDSKRRKLESHPRLIERRQLVYEMTAPLTFRPLGDPSTLQLNELRRRLLESMDGEWKATKSLIEELDEPRPGLETARFVLKGLALDRKIERDPPIASGTVQGKSVRWRRVQ